MNTSVKHPWLGLFGLSILSATAFLDVTIVYTAMPTIQSSLKVPVILLQWVMNIFTLALATLMVVAGKLGDIYGKRKIFYSGIVVFGLASIGAGISPHFWELVTFRAFQGMAAAITFTNSAALVPLLFPEEKRARAISIYTAITGFGLAFGPFLGGVLVSFGGWRWVFFVNIPLIIVGGILCIGNVMETERNPHKHIDWAGVGLMAVSLTVLLYTIINAAHIGFLHRVTLEELVIALLFFILFYRVERSSEHPLIHLEDVRNPKVQVGMTLCAIASVMTGSMMFIMPLYIHNVLGVSSLLLGGLMLSTPIMQVVVSAFWEKIYDNLGVIKPIALGIALLFISGLIQYTFTTSTSLFLVVLALVLMGVIWGVTNTACLTLASHAVPADRVGGAIGLIFTQWNVFGTIVLAITTTLFTTSEINAMQEALKEHHVKLTVAQHHQVAASLGDPAHAKSLLQNLFGDVSEKILPLFKQAFVTGYHCATLFALAVILLGAILMFAAYRRDKEPI